MDNATLNHQPSVNFQFLSVCHYINSFGLFFYNLDLISLEHRNHSSAVLNTYFEYIQKWKNPNEGKLKLLQRVLRGSDLYGGGENETLDMKYVNETYQYIISNVLFSHYGNIHGYLAGIINQADNITYLALKETVYQHFSKNYISKDYCSSRYESYELTQLTVDKVFLENVWSMFPSTEKNLEILNVDYIYAMIGFKIIGSLQVDRKNLTFDSYILLARSFEFQVLDDGEYQLVLELFATPALFYYAYYEKGKFRNGTLSLMMKTDTFWHDAYEKFFRFNNVALERIVQKELRKSLYYKLNLQVEKLESRTILAYKFLKLFCDSPKLGELSLALYKFSRWLMTIFLPDECKDVELPDLEEYFTMQFDPVRKTYNEIEQNSLEKVLTDGNLIQKMNSNTTVEFARVPSYPMNCMYCAPWPRKMNQDIYLLFAIVENNRKEFYAIRQVNNTLSLLTCSENEREFARAVAGDPSLKMETAVISNYLKQRGEDYKSFIQRVADIKTNQFIKGLMSYYRDPTDAENILDFLKSLVPFYTCIENIKSGNRGVAALTCSLDIISLFPIVHFAGKYSSIMLSSFISEIGRQSLRGISKSFFISRFMLRNGLFDIYNAISRTVSEQILNIGILKDLSIASLRTLDPGFELSYQIFSGFYNQVLRKLPKFLSSRFRKIPQAQNLLGAFESSIIKGNRSPVDHTGLVSKVLDVQNNYKIIRYIYPGGSNHFGPKCISSFGRIAELRTVHGNLYQVPVVKVNSNSPKDSISYREFDPQTGELSSEKLEIRGDDILRRIGHFISLIADDGIGDIPPIRDYQVYHNQIQWRKTPENVNIDENGNVVAQQVNRPLEIDRNTPGTSRQRPINTILPQTSSNTEIITQTYLHLQDIDRTVKLLAKFKEKGLLGLKDDTGELLSFRRIVHSMDLHQTRKIRKPPSELWFSQTLTRPSIVNDLKNLKGKDFYFNDITLVTDTDPSDIIPKKIPRYSLKTEVRYHMKIDSQYGLLDLAELDGNDFQNQYILFPEVNFFVTDTEFFNGKEILVVELQMKAISKAEWLKIREEEKMIIDSREIVPSERSNCIEKAALFISQNTPLHRFTETEVFLKSFILKLIDDGMNRVPSYDTFAKDIHSGVINPEKYNKWKIKNHIFIDDVLFLESLFQVGSFKSAHRTIYTVFNGLYNQKVRSLFDVYQNSPIIKSLVRFEDYYVINSFISDKLLSDRYATGRVATSIRRLALRQCGKEFLNPITIYFAANVPLDKFQTIIRFKTGDNIRFPVMQQFLPNRQILLNNLRITRPTEMLVLYQLDVTNRAGIADLSSIVTDYERFYIPEELKMKIISRSKETIEGRDVFLVKLEDNIMMTTEKRMVLIVNKLNELFSPEPKYYINVDDRQSELTQDFA